MQSRVKPGEKKPGEHEGGRGAGNVIPSPFTQTHPEPSRKERAEEFLAFIDEQIGKVNQLGPFAAEREDKIERGELQARRVKVPKGVISQER